MRILASVDNMVLDRNKGMEMVGKKEWYTSARAAYAQDHCCCHTQRDLDSCGDRLHHTWGGDVTGQGLPGCLKP